MLRASTRVVPYACTCWVENNETRRKDYMKGDMEMVIMTEEDAPHSEELSRIV